jgi:hypothetical protein
MAQVKELFEQFKQLLLLGQAPRLEDFLVQTSSKEDRQDGQPCRVLDQSNTPIRPKRRYLAGSLCKYVRCDRSCNFS